MPDRHQITVLYGENRLHKTISIPSYATVKFAKEIAAKEMLKHIILQPGVPPSISIDEECTDFYPDASDDTKLQDLAGQETIIVWPKATSGGYTPSIILDALSSKSKEVEELKAQRGAEELVRGEEQLQQKPKGKGKKSNKASSSTLPPPSASSPSTSTPLPPVSNDSNVLEMILGRLTVIETENKDLKDRLTVVETENKELRTENKELRTEVGDLRTENKDLRDRLTVIEVENKDLRAEVNRLDETSQTTMNAVLGDRIAINKIRRRVLLDKGRTTLASICGHNSWKLWKAQSASKEEMLALASSRLRIASDQVTPIWIKLGGQPSALEKLLYPNRLRELGDEAAHNSTSKDIADGVLSLVGEQNRKDMILIFEAVYNTNPETLLDQDA